VGKGEGKDSLDTGFRAHSKAKRGRQARHAYQAVDPVPDTRQCSRGYVLWKALATGDR